MGTLSSAHEAAQRLSISRRAFGFTVIGVLMVALAIFIYRFDPQYAVSTNMELFTRVETLDSFVSALEDDLARVVYIGGFRSFIAMEEHISNTSSFISNPRTAFSEALLNGSIENNSISIMDDSSMQAYLDRLAITSSQSGISTVLNVGDVTLTHDGPFNVNVTVEVFYNVTDVSGIATFEGNWTIGTRIPIVSLRDPLYTVGTTGKIPRVIEISNVSTPYILANNDTTNLQLVLNNSYYIESNYSPSFIMRFAGNLSASENGIQSLVYLPDLEGVGITPLTDRSIVDFQYFNVSSTTTNRIVNMQSWFLLSDDDLEIYNATDKTI